METIEPQKCADSIVPTAPKIQEQERHMDLFDYQREKLLSKEAPLAHRMRPKTLEDFEGQEHIVGKGTLLYRAIKADKLSSITYRKWIGEQFI